MRRYIISLLLFSLFITPVVAQETPEPLPESALLAGVRLVWQDWNRCSAAALTMQLSFWRDEANYRDTVNHLNPYSSDVSVRFDEMIAYAETFGVRGVVRMGGTTDMLKRLVANGFPVLVENSHFVDSRSLRNWTSHNRVIVGYDDGAGVFYAMDSVLGGGPDKSGRPFTYTEFEELWRQLNHTYLVLYDPVHETRLREIIGQQWDPVFNAEWTLARAQANLYNQNHDGFDNFNMGTALVALGEYERAIQAYEVAEEIGLPWRMLWYQFGPLEAYLQTERYADAQTLAREVLAGSPHVEEMYYYIARAYLGQGNIERAVENLELVTRRNPHFTVAVDLLDEIRGETVDLGN